MLYFINWFFFLALSNGVQGWYKYCMVYLHIAVRNCYDAMNDSNSNILNHVLKFLGRVGLRTGMPTGCRVRVWDASHGMQEESWQEAHCAKTRLGYCESAWSMCRTTTEWRDHGVSQQQAVLYRQQAYALWVCICGGGTGILTAWHRHSAELVGGMWRMTTAC